MMSSSHDDWANAHEKLKSENAKLRSLLFTKGVPMQFSMNAAPHAAEAAMTAQITEANPSLGATVSEARAVGISWLTIFQILITYGPQAMAVIRAIIDALKTPTV